MADTFIRLPADGTGKRVRSFEYDVGGTQVHSQAQTPVGPNGEVVSIKNVDALGSEYGIVTRNIPTGEETAANRYGGGKLTTALEISTAGNNTVLSPGVGNSIRLYWIGLSSSENNTAEVLATVKFGAEVKYRWYLGAPGAFSKWEVIDGEVDEDLVIELSAAQPVQVNLTYIEL